MAFAGSTLLPGMLHGGETDGTYNSCFKTQLVQATWQNLLQLQRLASNILIDYVKLYDSRLSRDSILVMQ